MDSSLLASFVRVSLPASITESRHIVAVKTELCFQCTCYLGGRGFALCMEARPELHPGSWALSQTHSRSSLLVAGVQGTSSWRPEFSLLHGPLHSYLGPSLVWPGLDTRADGTCCSFVSRQLVLVLLQGSGLALTHVQIS